MLPPSSAPAWAVDGGEAGHGQAREPGRQASNGAVLTATMTLARA